MRNIPDLFIQLSYFIKQYHDVNNTKSQKQKKQNGLCVLGFQPVKDDSYVHSRIISCQGPLAPMDGVW